jgi:hypothetical protein
MLLAADLEPVPKDSEVNQQSAKQVTGAIFVRPS